MAAYIARNLLLMAEDIPTVERNTKHAISRIQRHDALRLPLCCLLVMLTPACAASAFDQIPDDSAESDDDTGADSAKGRAVTSDTNAEESPGSRPTDLPNEVADDSRRDDDVNSAGDEGGSEATNEVERTPTPATGTPSSPTAPGSEPQLPEEPRATTPSEEEPDAPFKCGIVCGNGALNKGETCDDRNAQSGDGCDGECQVEPGWLCPDVGEPCQLDDCGNGALDEAEQCDDGNRIPNDGCDAQCRVESSFVCRAGECILMTCGDGIVSGMEWCDDGNVTSGDGCSADCGTVEPGYACRQPGRNCEELPANCSAACGDGVVECAELCDDGPANGAYGACGEDCLPGPRCGDAIVQPQELCDDGLNRGGYGNCGASCEAAQRCGDGVVQSDYEECDDGVNDGQERSNRCMPGCRAPSFCGDGILQTEFDEECEPPLLGDGPCDRECHVVHCVTR